MEGFLRRYLRPSLRWHYPDQVPAVGGDPHGHPLSPASPSSPGRTTEHLEYTADAVQCKTSHDRESPGLLRQLRNAEGQIGALSGIALELIAPLQVHLTRRIPSRTRSIRLDEPGTCNGGTLGLEDLPGERPLPVRDDVRAPERRCAAFPPLQRSPQNPCTPSWRERGADRCRLAGAPGKDPQPALEGTPTNAAA